MCCYRSAKAVRRGSAGAVRETFGSDLICPCFQYKSRWIGSPSFSIRQSRYFANPGLQDADSDGRGNLCDADLNNSGTVTTADFGLLRSVLNQSASTSPTAAAADLNGSGVVTTSDFAILRPRLNTAPRPSGLGCAGSVPFP